VWGENEDGEAYVCIPALRQQRDEVRRGRIEMNQVEIVVVKQVEIKKLSRGEMAVFAAAFESAHLQGNHGNVAVVDAYHAVLELRDSRALIEKEYGRGRGVTEMLHEMLYDEEG
jgi:hypothetical protein